MPTDDERRDVARRLREMSGWGGEVDCAEWGERVLNLLYRDGEDRTEGEYYARLADLIEPGEPKVKCVAEVKIEGDKLDEAVHRAMAEYTGVDRDALLALADEFESGARDARAHKWNEPANAAMAIALADEYEANARRIREACGEVDG